MANAAIDANSKQTATARLKTDGSLVRLTANPTTGVLDTTTVTTGAASPSSSADVDENGRMSLLAVSESDPTILVALQCDSSGALLIKPI